MKILYILSQKPGNTGSGVYIKYLLKEALKHKIDFRVIVGITNESDLKELAHINRENIFPVIFGEHIPFQIAGMSDVMPYESIKFSQFNDTMYQDYCNGFLKIFKKATFNWKPDIIHSNHLWIVTAISKRYFENTPVIASCHGTCLRQKVLSPFIEEKIRNNLKEVDTILALTEKQKNQIIKWLEIDESKVIVSGSGYADDIFYIKHGKYIDKSNLKIIYAGKISNAKGVPYLVEAYKKLPLKLQNKIKLFIAGDYNNIEGEKIRNKIILEHIPNVIFLGKLSQEELAEKMRECHIFILPSFFEGLPLVVIESLACGCVAIVTRLPDLEQWIEKELVEGELIKFIPLPKLKSVDEPLDSEIDKFVENIKKAILYYADRFFQNEFIDTEKFLNIIKKYSFKELFNRILEIYKNMVINS